MPVRSALSISLVEPAAAWEAWSLQDVGIFDGALFAVGAAAIFFLSTSADETEESSSIDPEEAAPPARDAARDPNELQPFAALRRRGSPPTMQIPAVTQRQLTAVALLRSCARDAIANIGLSYVDKAGAASYSDVQRA